MRLSKLPSNRITLLLGGPRSGTTWLGKIFDSHPNILYRFEPDRVRRGSYLPEMCKPQDIELYRDAAHDYLQDLLRTHTLTSVGTMPIFAKRYRGMFGDPTHGFLVRSLRKIMRKRRKWRRRIRRISIPDFIRGRRAKAMHAVIKSVSSRGRARLFAEAMPDARIIFLVRDAFGHVAAMIRGNRTGQYTGAVRVEALLSTEQAARYGLTPQVFDALPMVERFAWEWAILNQLALEGLEGLPQVKVVRYQDLCANPITTCRELFNFLDLPWAQETEVFLRSSTDYSGNDPYLRLFRNTRRNVNRWRKELSHDDQLRIRRIAQTTAMWQFCPELDAT